jgi:HlyD family secretion protein
MAKLAIPQIAMNKKVLAGVAAGAIILIGGAAVMAGGKGSAKPGKYEYETVAIEKGTVSRVVSASGAVQPREKVDVGSEVSGKIVAVKVDFNDPVKKGQVMAVVDPETFQNTLDQNRARLRQSEASVANANTSVSRAQVALDKAEKDYNRQKALFEQGAIAQAAWETADQTYTNAKLALQSERDSLKSANAGLETSRATVADSLTKLERTNIRSPLDGVVISRKLEVGQTVQSSQSIATLFVVAADLSEIEIEAAVVESDIGGIDNGDPVRFNVDAFPGEQFLGSVVQVRKLGAEQANVVTYTVVVNARNPNGKLLPGMTANVEITADRAENVLRIAEGATKYQPPKDVMEKLCADRPGPGCPRPAGAQGGPGGPGGGFGGPGGQGGPGGGQGGPQVASAGGEGQRGGQGGGNRGGQGGQGGNRGGQGGFGGGQNPMNEWLSAAGVDQARIEKITTDMDAERQRIMASMPRPQGGPQIVGAGNFGPPPGMQQQQQMNEMRTKMQTAQETVLKRYLNDEEYAVVQKHRAEMQSQKRVTAYKVNDKGELEPHMLMIGLSDGSFAQVVRNAEEGDKFVIRSTAAGGKDKK